MLETLELWDPASLDGRESIGADLRRQLSADDSAYNVRSAKTPSKEKLLERISRIFQ